MDRVDTLSLVSEATSPESQFRPLGRLFAAAHAGQAVLDSVHGLSIAVLPTVERPRVATFEWDMPDGWRTVGTVAWFETGLGFSELGVLAPPGSPGGVTGTELRQVRPPRLLSLIASQLMARQKVERTFRGLPQEIEGDRAIRTAEKRVGRPPVWSREHYRRVALLAIEESEKGVRGDGGLLARMARKLSKELGRPVARETVRHWMSDARNQWGFLSPTTRGSSTPKPGPALLEKRTP